MTSLVNDVTHFKNDVSDLPREHTSGTPEAAGRTARTKPIENSL